ncbi:phage major capsid protein [Pseudaquabacterium pictum]|uniref:Phage capsid-like C-terminal domain-containing protein n=1 Tax=Pseudaquabacterium pictum TaxID=2315236 RepID=A0A480AJY0_9BURK|nr:phage major capsid protein [Rubrivivax pictus]GCL61020.1 hypothetical protein AQPW35_01010 [Rubrivivax pictus]
MKHTRTLAILAAAALASFAAFAGGFADPILALFSSEPSGGLMLAMAAGAVDMGLIMKGLDAIETRLQKLPELAAQQLELADRLQSLEQKQFQPTGGPGPTARSFGADVAEQFTKNKELFARTKSISLEVKANPGNFATVLGTHRSISGTGGPGLSPTLLVSRMRNRALLGTTTLHYGRRRVALANGQGAAVQAEEGANKNEVRPIFDAIAQTAVTVAGYCPVSNQSLNAEGELQAIVNQVLMREVMIAADVTLVAGTTAVGWSFPGLKSIAADYVSTVYTGLADTVVEVASHMRWGGYQPTIVVMNPMSYLGIALAKSTTGEYLTGQYMGEIPLVLHGMSVCFSSEIAIGRALLIDENFVELGIADAFKVDIGTVDGQFVQNMQTIRAEIGILPIVRDAGAVMEAIPKAP